MKFNVFFLINGIKKFSGKRNEYINIQVEARDQNSAIRKAVKESKRRLYKGFGELTLFTVEEVYKY